MCVPEYFVHLYTHEERRDPEPLDHRCATCTPILDAYPSHNPLIEYAKIDFKVRVVICKGDCMDERPFAMSYSLCCIINVVLFYIFNCVEK